MSEITKRVNELYTALAHCKDSAEMKNQIIKAFENEQEITRRACAENVNKLKNVELSRFPHPLVLDGCISRDKTQSEILKTKII